MADLPKWSRAARAESSAFRLTAGRQRAAGDLAAAKADRDRRQAWQARANWFDELIGQRNRQRQERETKKQERDGPGWHHQ